MQAVTMVGASSYVSANGSVLTMAEVWDHFSADPERDDQLIASPTRAPLLTPALDERTGTIDWRPVGALGRRATEEHHRAQQLVGPLLREGREQLPLLPVVRRLAVRAFHHRHRMLTVWRVRRPGAVRHHRAALYANGPSDAGLLRLAYQRPLSRFSLHH